MRAQTKKRVLGAGTAPKKGGLRCGHNQKKGGIRHVYNTKKREFRTDFVKREGVRNWSFSKGCLVGTVRKRGVLGAGQTRKKGRLRCRSGPKRGVFTAAHTYTEHMWEPPPPRGCMIDDLPANIHGHWYSSEKGWEVGGGGGAQLCLYHDFIYQIDAQQLCKHFNFIWFVSLGFFPSYLLHSILTL